MTARSAFCSPSQRRGGGHVDRGAQVEVRNLALRPGHRRGDRASHLRRRIGLRRSRWGCTCGAGGGDGRLGSRSGRRGSGLRCGGRRCSGLDIAAHDPSHRARAVDGFGIDAELGSEPAGRRRDAHAGRLGLTAVGADGGERRAHRDHGARIHEDPLHDSGHEALNLDLALVGLDLGDDLAACDLLARLSSPLDEPPASMSAPRSRHDEVDHHATTARRPRRSGRGRAAPHPPDAWHRASAPRRRRPARPAHRASSKPCSIDLRADLCREAAGAPALIDNRRTTVCLVRRTRAPSPCPAAAAREGRSPPTSMPCSASVSAASSVLPSDAAVSDERHVAARAPDGRLLDVRRRRRSHRSRLPAGTASHARR